MRAVPGSGEHVRTPHKGVPGKAATPQYGPLIQGAGDYSAAEQVPAGIFMWDRDQRSEMPPKMVNARQNLMDERGAHPSQADVRAALDRMFEHPEFRASKRRRAFLSFVVEEALAGRGPALKGFAIAHSVFGRDENFDPKTDPVVRLEARRLRQDLDSYYVGPGADDPVRISIPKGRYEPLFEVRPPQVATTVAPVAPTEVSSVAPPQAKTRKSRRKAPLMAAIFAGLAVVAVISLWLFRADGVAVTDRTVAEFPRVAILPFEALDPSPTTRTLSLGLSSELVLKLRGFDNLRLFAPLAATNLTERMAELGADGVPTYLVHGTVQTEGEAVSVNVQLLSAITDELVWGESYDLHLNPGALIDLRNSVSAEIATAIGQPYGPLSADIMARADASPAPTSLNSYLCVLEAIAYRQKFSSTAYQTVRACLEETVAQSPDYAEAWAMLGWLQLDAARFGFVPAEQADAEIAAALEVAEHAYSMAPDNVLAAKALSSIHHYTGNYSESERYGRIALDLNPHDPDTLAQVGWRLSVRGKFDEGGPLMAQAIQRTVDPPGWYYHLPSLQHFMQGNFERALEEAEIAASKGTGFAWFLVAINAAALGDAEKTALALDVLSAHPYISADPAAFLRRHGAIDEIVLKATAAYGAAQRLAPF